MPMEIKNSNRTNTCENYYPNLSIHNVNHLCEYLGYEGYLPEMLLRDLINVFCYRIIENDHTLAFNNNTSDVMKEFFNSLTYDYFKGESPLEMSIDLLKTLSETYNLRMLENGKVKEVKVLDNYFLELDDRDFEVDIESLDIDYNKILKISSKVLDSFNIKKGLEGENVSKRITSYSDIVKTKKSNFVRPDFNIKLVNKSFYKKDKFVEDENKDILIFIEDASKSMGVGNGLSLVKAVQREIINDVRDVHYYRHMGHSIDFVELTTREDKIKFFNTKKGYHDYVLNYNMLFELLNKYNNCEVIIATDGKDPIPYYDNGLKINFISLKSNASIINLCKSSGGKLLIV